MAKKSKKQEKLVTNSEIACIVDNEGLEYAITGYMTSENFEDKEMAEWWTQAKDLLNKIEERLEEASEREYDSGDV